MRLRAAHQVDLGHPELLDILSDLLQRLGRPPAAAARRDPISGRNLAAWQGRFDSGAFSPTVGRGLLGDARRCEEGRLQPTRMKLASGDNLAEWRGSKVAAPWW